MQKKDDPKAQEEDVQAPGDEHRMEQIRELLFGEQQAHTDTLLGEHKASIDDLRDSLAAAVRDLQKAQRAQAGDADEALRALHGELDAHVQKLGDGIDALDAATREHLQAVRDAFADADRILDERLARQIETTRRDSVNRGELADLLQTVAEQLRTGGGGST